MNDFNRDRWGRPVITQVDGSTLPYTRISSYGQNLENQTGLTQWKLRTVVAGAATRPDLLSLASAHAGDNKQIDRLVQEMLDAGGASKAANTGTAIHEVLAQLDAGSLARTDVPDSFLGYMQTWYTCIEAFGFEVIPQMVELKLVNDHYQAAGSGDNFLYRTSDGKLVAVDKKTGKSVMNKPLAYMVQLALYATSYEYDIATGLRSALPNVDTDVAYIAHIPAAGGQCVLYEVDVQASLKLADLSQAIRHAEKLTPAIKKMTEPPSLPKAEPPPPDSEVRRLLMDRVKALATAGHAKTLVAFWSDDIPTFKQSSSHTSEQLQRITKTIESAEALHSMPFMAEPAIIEGNDVDITTVESLRATIKALPVQKRKRLEAWAKEASESGQSVSLTVTPSMRRYLIATAMIALLKTKEPAKVVQMTHATVGATLSRYTISQAENLIEKLTKLETEKPK